MIQTRPCPSPEILQQLVQGTYAGPDVATLGEHLLACRECGAKVEQLAGPDPLIAELRAAHDTGNPMSHSTFIEEMLRRVKTPSPSAPGSVPGGELAFLSPPLPEFPNDLGLLDRYRVVELLGEGGMGMVFRAFDPMLKRTVALKVILPKYASNTKLRERFLEEARMTVAVRSPHVAEVYNCGVWNDVPYLTMELLTGMTLDKKPRPMPTDSWRRIAYSIAKGLADAHSTGMIHRDLKPSNIHLGTDPRTHKPTVKIIDFGLARPVDRAIEITKSGELLGTPAYMSPEQARGKKVDHRTDLYALGVILYQLATGDLPYQGANEGVMAILTELATPEPLPSVAQLAPNLPPTLTKLIDSLLQKDPANRPASANDVMKMLKASLNEKAPGATEVIPSSPYVSIPESNSIATDATPNDATEPALSSPAPDQRLRAVNGTDSVTAPTEVESAPPTAVARHRSKWYWPRISLVAMTAVGLILFAVGVFKVKTTDGIIEIRDLDPEAEVLVNGEVVTVTRDGQTAEIRIPPGQTKKVEVRVDGVVVVGEEVTVAQGERKPLVVKYTDDDPGKAAAPGLAATPGSSLPSGELVKNGNCSLPNLEGWQIISGRWYQKSPGRDPYFCAGNCRIGVLEQDVDVSQYWRSIETGGLDFTVKVMFRSFDADRARLEMIFLDQDKKRLTMGHDTGEHAHKGRWIQHTGTVTPPSKTRFVRLVLTSYRSPRPGNEENSGYIDDVSLRAEPLKRKSSAAPAQFVPLFNGINLAGWNPVGNTNASWRVVNGLLIGSWPLKADVTGGSSLVSEKSYRHFHLRVQHYPSEIWASRIYLLPGSLIQPKAGQYKIWLGSPQNDANEEIGRLTIGPSNTLPWKNLPPRVGPNSLVTLEVIVHGNRIQVKVDGVTTADYTDPAMPADGDRIKLHCAGGSRIRFRSIEIQELPAPEDNEPGSSTATEFVSLFNGQDITDWKRFGNPRGTWTIQDGVLSGKCPVSNYYGGAELWRSDHSYRNFHLRIEAKRSVGSPSRLYLCGNPTGDLGNSDHRVWLGDPSGDPDRDIGRVWYPQGRDSKTKAPRVGTPASIPDGEWFTMDVIVNGQSLTVDVNDTRVTEIANANIPAKPVPVILDCADGGQIAFRKVEIRELK